MMHDQDVLEWLQNWYLSQCNEDWEHEYGITIETIDNPGWYMTIDLTDTVYAEKYLTSQKYEASSNDWYFYFIKDGKFEASCSPCNLTKVLSIFREWIQSYER